MKKTTLNSLIQLQLGMLPTIKGISDSAAYKENETRKKFKHAEEVITEAVKKRYCYWL